MYEDLAKLPGGRSVKDLLLDLDIPEVELRETLRKLDQAGLAQRIKGNWTAVPLEDAPPAPPAAPESDEPPAAES